MITLQQGLLIHIRNLGDHAKVTTEVIWNISSTPRNIPRDPAGSSERRESRVLNEIELFQQSLQGGSEMYVSVQLCCTRYGG
jgi:hypothetical protein